MTVSPDVDEGMSHHQRVRTAGTTADRVGDAGLLGTRDEVVDEHAEAPLAVGAKVSDDLDEFVYAAEEFDDDAFDAQVVTPDLLYELGIVAALDVDAAWQVPRGLFAPETATEPDAVRVRRNQGRPSGGEDYRLAVDQVAGTDREWAACVPGGPRAPSGRTRREPLRRRSRSARPRRPGRVRRGAPWTEGAARRADLGQARRSRSDQSLAES